MHTRKRLKPSLKMDVVIHNNVGRQPTDADRLRLMRQLYESLTDEGREKLKVALAVYLLKPGPMETFNQAATEVISLKTAPLPARESHKVVKGWGR